MNLATYIDHTFLKPEATTANITLLCQEAIQYSFHAICVNSGLVPFAYSCIKNHPINVVSTVGFPLGSMSTESKIAETRQAIKDGASEIDMVINIGYLKSHDQEKITLMLDELKAMREATKDLILKVIIETCLLTDDEKKTACGLCCTAKVDFVKTSTGFSSGGASIIDIALIKSMLEGTPLKIKASGGIRDYDTAMQFIKAGANRIGTSNSVAIVKHAHNALDDGY